MRASRTWTARPRWPNTRPLTHSAASPSGRNLSSPTCDRRGYLPTSPPPHLLTSSPPHLPTSSPPRVLTPSPPHHLTTLPPHLLTSSPPHHPTFSPPHHPTFSRPHHPTFSPPHLPTTSPPHLLTSSPPHHLTSSRPHLLTSPPPHHLTTSPPHILTASPPHHLTDRPTQLSQVKFNYRGAASQCDESWGELFMKKVKDAFRRSNKRRPIKQARGGQTAWARPRPRPQGGQGRCSGLATQSVDCVPHSLSQTAISVDSAVGEGQGGALIHVATYPWG